MPPVENSDGENISLHVNLFRAYLEASAIRHHAAQFNYIFSDIPCEFAEGIEPIRDNFQLSFRKRSFRSANFTWLPPAWLDLSVDRKQNRARQYKYGSSTPGENGDDTGNASTRIIWPAVRRDVRTRRRNETRRSRNRQILLITRINIRNWAEYFGPPGFQFPQIVSDTPTPPSRAFERARTTGETFGKPINDATRDEKNFWNLQPRPRNRSRAGHTGNGFQATILENSETTWNFIGWRAVWRDSTFFRPRIPWIIFKLDRSSNLKEKKIV